MAKLPSTSLNEEPPLRESAFARELPACGNPFTPRYQPAPGSPEAGLLPQVLSEPESALSGGFADRFDEAAKPTIRVDTTSGAWWSQGAFRPPVDVVQNVRTSLRGYEAYLQERPELRVLARPIVRSPATELPLSLPGELLAAPEQAEQAIDLFKEWMNDVPLPGPGNAGKSMADALLGRRDWQQFFPEAGEMTYQLAQVEMGESSTFSPEFLSPRYYVRLQQHFKEYPVLGGQLSSRLVQDELDVVCNSTYLPVPEDALAYVDGREHLCEEQAMLVAAKAVAHMLAPDKAGEDGEGVEELPGAHALEPDELVPSAENGWEIRIRRFGEGALCVAPYRTEERNFHLAYEVRLTEPDFGGTWSVFVEAVSGQVLDRPSLLTHHAPVYASSAEVLAGLEPSLALATHTNPSSAFMDVEKFSTDAANSMVDWSSTVCNGPDFEAIQVGFHALRVYQALRSAGVAAADMQTPEKRLLTVVFTRGKHPPALEMGFDPGSTPPTITFQRDSNDGLSSFGKKVFNPARDPEVIYHEVFHGLSWMLNPDPFDNQIGTAPFARALAEGVAIYFARSIAQQHTQDDEVRWAVAAYHTAFWNTQWALERNQAVVGGDLLPFANLYPDASDKTGWELSIYDVGMIWARALWDLRRFLSPQEVDVLALRSFLAARGWVTSFEVLAEAVLHELSGDPLLQAAVTRLLQARGIVAAADVRALLADGDLILAGGDKESLASPDGGLNWESLPLSGVVDLAATTEHLYALTDVGVYQCSRDDMQQWTLIGDIAQPGQQGRNLGRPLSLAATSGGNLFLGAGGGVYTATANNPLQWSPVPTTEANPLIGLPLDMALIPSAAATHLVAAGFRAVWVRPLPVDASKDWKQIGLSDRSQDLVVCITSHNADVHVGTCRSGIWQGAPNALGFFAPKQIATPANLGDGAVLCLAARLQPSIGLFAGTTAGLFVGAPSHTGAWSWKAVAGLPDGAFPTALAMQAGALFVGTAHHGLWRQDAAGDWSPVQGLQALGVQPAIIDLSPSAELRENIPGVLTHFRPFQVKQELRLAVTTALVAGAQAPTLTVRRLTPGLPVILQSGASTFTSSSPLTKGFYVLIVSGSDDFHVTLSLI